jgi:hypothetical protein
VAWHVSIWAAPYKIEIGANNPNADESLFIDKHNEKIEIGFYDALPKYFDQIEKWRAGLIFDDHFSKTFLCENNHAAPAFNSTCHVWREWS